MVVSRGREGARADMLRYRHVISRDFFFGFSLALLFSGFLDESTRLSLASDRGLLSFYYGGWLATFSLPGPCTTPLHRPANKKKL